MPSTIYFLTRDNNRGRMVAIDDTAQKRHCAKIAAEGGRVTAIVPGIRNDWLPNVAGRA